MRIEIALPRATIRGIRDYFVRAGKFRDCRLVVSLLYFLHAQPHAYYVSRANMNLFQLNPPKYRDST